MTSCEEFNTDSTASAASCACQNQVLAMAYVPDQEWGDLYDEAIALQRGTLFPELDKPFTGRRQVRNG